MNAVRTIRREPKAKCHLIGFLLVARGHWQLIWLKVVSKTFNKIKNDVCRPANFASLLDKVADSVDFIT